MVSKNMVADPLSAPKTSEGNMITLAASRNDKDSTTPAKNTSPFENDAEEPKKAKAKESKSKNMTATDTEDGIP